MLSLAGLIIILALVAILIRSKVLPIVALTLVPLAGALLAGFTPTQVNDYFNSGLKRVAPIGVMFLFAILFFGVLQDAGLFRPLIRAMVKLTRANVVVVAIMTALLGMLAHLDGAGTTTFLLTIPSLLPLYRRLGMSPYLLLLLLAIGAGVFNMLPWAGPLGRAAVVTKLDVIELWHPLIGVQVVGAVLLVALSAWLGLRERQRIAAGGTLGPAVQASFANVDGDMDYAQTSQLPRRPWLNLLLFVSVLGSLISNILQPAYVFMIGLSLALLLNYPSAKQQVERVAAHAPGAVRASAIVFAAGSFLGIMDGTGMLKSIAQQLAHALPDAMLPHLHLLLGLIGVPMELVLSTDAYYFALLPVAQEIVAPFGVPPAATVYALLISNIVGTFISPYSAALWLALGLADLDMGRFIRYALGWMWSYSLVLFGYAWLIGLV